AHEVNNSLAVIVANASFVLEQLSETRAALEPLSSAAATALRRIDDALQAEVELQVAADRIRHTMTDLKAFSRPVVAVSGRADVRRAIGWALRVTAPELGGRARIATRLGELPLIRADEAQLGEVLARLLSNAAHSIVLAPNGIARDGAAHNEVALSAQLDADGSISITVRDSGAGMPAELQRHIFEPFFSSGLARGGSGIGLAVCHGFVRSLGGEIDVESAVGKGTTFRIRLPASLRLPAEPSPAPVQLTPARQGRILVVDDNELVLRTVRRMLRDHDVVLARDGVEALELLEREDPFDLVLSDVVMPRMTGIELYEELLAHHLETARRVVFMSGGAVTAHAEDFLRAVPNRRIEKPFTSAQLSVLIEQCLSERREPAPKHPSGVEAC
ncbi:MAG TPA: ATP-binding protein, partial [Polyangiaceae bacterium]|nr:ATP-binding protein [Polyangiaceae bacterium]